MAGGKLMRVLRVAGPLLVFLFSLASLFGGLCLCFYVQQRRSGGTFYTWHTYWEESSLVSMATGCVVFGVAGLAAVVITILLRKDSPTWRGIRLKLGASALLQVVILSLFYSSGLHGAQLGMTTQLYITAVWLERWADERERFPANEGEFRDLVAPLESSEFLGPFERGGQPVLHRHVYIKDAAGPHLPPRPDAEPGVVYCAISPDSKEFWLTASALYVPVGKSSVWLRSLDGKPWVMHCKLNWKCQPPIPFEQPGRSAQAPR